MQFLRMRNVWTSGFKWESYQGLSRTNGDVHLGIQSFLVYIYIFMVGCPAMKWAPGEIKDTYDSLIQSLILHLYYTHFHNVTVHLLFNLRFVQVTAEFSERIWNVPAMYGRALRRAGILA